MSDAAADPSENSERAHDAFHDATITFLFTDIEGSTALWQHAPREMRAALERHDMLLQETITRFGGQVFKRMGDAFHAAFPNASSALESALAAQRALIALGVEEKTTLRVRMALNSGTAQQRDGDYYGGALSRTSRLRDALHGGQIALTQAAVSLLRDSTTACASPSHYELRDLGQFSLRDLDEPERVFQVVAPDLPSSFPPLRTPASFPHNLPRQFTSFIGREREIEETTRLLTTSSLVTITGPGGSGKTRLAVQAAAEHLSLFRDGVWFIDLGPLTEAVQVAQTVAAVLQVREESGRPASETVIAHLQAKNVLILLDNCEHLVEECARFARSLLLACPDVKILATSREGLDIPGEIACPLLPLPQPDGVKEQSVARIARYESVRLFTERATTVAQNFALTRENAGAVARICRRLDGIPLAIELAAAWTNVLTPQQVEARLDDRFRFLSKSSRTALPRQQTLRAAMDWSYDLLGEPERLLLARLSVFSGSFNLNAAEQICSDETLATYEVLEILYQLVHKSLVVRSDEKGEARFRLLESIREYAGTQLEQRNEEVITAVRHADYYRALGEEAEPHLRGSEQKVWLDLIETEHDNIRAVLSRNAVPVQTRLAVAAAVFWFWRVRGFCTEGRRWIEPLLSLPAEEIPDVELARANRAAGILAMEAGELEIANLYFLTALTQYESAGKPGDAAAILANMGIAASHRGNYEEARTHLERSLNLCRQSGDETRIAMVLSNLGSVVIRLGDAKAASKILQESLLLHRQRNDEVSIAGDLHNLGEALLRTNADSEAKQYLLESAQIKQKLGNRTTLAQTLTLIGLLYYRQNHSVLASRLMGCAEVLRERSGTPLDVEERLVWDKLKNDLCSHIGNEQFSNCWQEGRTMSPGEIIHQSRQESI